MRRCLALADELKRRARIVFVLDPQGAEVWGPAVTSAGMEWAVAGAAEISGLWDGCVIDGYEFGPPAIAKWRKLARRVVVIDDLGLGFADTDVIVRTAASPQQSDRACPLVLAGPQYAMLDKAYLKAPRGAVSDRVEKILVSFGLRDSAGGTLLALEAFRVLANAGFQPQITVALGSGAPDLQRVETQTAAFGNRVRLAVDATDMRALLDDADLAVGAGGVGLQERLAAGVPSLTLTVADNQRPWARLASNAGATIDLGEIAMATPQSLADAIRDLAADRSRRRRLAECGRSLVDGRGAERVVHTMLEFAPCN